MESEFFRCVFLRLLATSKGQLRLGLPRRGMVVWYSSFVRCIEAPFAKLWKMGFLWIINGLAQDWQHLLEYLEIISPETRNLTWAIFWCFLHSRYQWKSVPECLRPILNPYRPERLQVEEVDLPGLQSRTKSHQWLDSTRLKSTWRAGVASRGNTIGGECLRWDVGIRNYIPLENYCTPENAHQSNLFKSWSVSLHQEWAQYNYLK
jgi:hypothetical protein